MCGCVRKRESGGNSKRESESESARAHHTHKRIARVEWSAEWSAEWGVEGEGCVSEIGRAHV